MVKFITQDALFLDARSRADYQLGHIKGALNLPVHDEDFGERLHEFVLEVNHDRELIVYCEDIDPTLSPELASILTSMGYKKVKILANGWSEWNVAAMPFEVDR
ncbi:MAG: rhodanese-like domain-containing protein [Syntrophobacterales bacterium]|nr:MAG: rhodanese-like domain-containing protein [Syntrophobacterales bacterium]